MQQAHDHVAPCSSEEEKDKKATIPLPVASNEPNSVHSSNSDPGPSVASSFEACIINYNDYSDNFKFVTSENSLSANVHSRVLGEITIPYLQIKQIHDNTPTFPMEHLSDKKPQISENNSECESEQESTPATESPTECNMPEKEDLIFRPFSRTNHSCWLYLESISYL